MSRRQRRMRAIARSYANEDRQEARELAALVEKYGGDPRSPVPELARPEPGWGVRDTVMPNVHAVCFVCRETLVRGQVAGVVRGRYIHAGRCSAVVRELLIAEKERATGTR